MWRVLVIAALLAFDPAPADAQTPEEVRAEELTELGRTAHRAFDFETALRHYRAAAEMGSTRARANIGLLYLRGHGVPKDVETGLAMLREAAASSDPHSMYVLGASLGGRKHPEAANAEARAWLERAADAGHVPAMVMLSEAFRFGVGIPKDPGKAEAVRAKARAMLRAAAGEGSAEAMLALGRIYMHGIQVEEDLEEAERWLVQAAQPENIVARRYLGSLYKKTALYGEARRVFEALAEEGDQGGMHHLSTLYRDGVGVDRSYERAAYWFLQSGKARGTGVIVSVDHLPQDYRRALQRQLKAEGLYDGPVDGAVTPELQTAIVCYPKNCDR